jgi:CubicO group peptidase (beta-lactamase class C family)
LGKRVLQVCALIWAGVPAPSDAADLKQLMAQARVPGVSIAVIRKGKIAELTQMGVRTASTGVPVDADTVFAAASLSKPVFAYAVLQLVDAGVLSLDATLSSYVPDFVTDDPRAAGLTLRHVLSHTTGLPNWRGLTHPLKTHLEPGTRFSYSGEAFVWLQRVVEAATGETLEALVRRLVFDPLDMRRSSFVWRPDFDADHADGHDANAAPLALKKPPQANAAFSLHTTAADYARFMQAVLSGARLKPTTARLWLEPQVRLRHRCYQCLAPAIPESDQRVAWGLGWGLEPGRRTFFHWGDNGRFKTFAIGSVPRRTAVIVFTNGSNGMAIMPALVGRWMPGDHPVFRWLNYPRQVPGSR